MNLFKALDKQKLEKIRSQIKPLYQSVLESIKQFQPSKKSLLVVVLTIVVIVGGGFLLFSKRTPTIQKPDLSMVRFNIEHNTLTAIGQTLNGVASKIAVMEKEVQAGKSTSNINVEKLTKQLQDIEKKVNGATAVSASALSNEIAHSTNALKVQLNSINQRLKSIQSQKSNIKQLPVSSLLFKVLYIENIQGNTVITLSYNHSTFPLMVGETFQGFRLSKADYGQQTAVFTNEKHQEVTIHLSSVESQGDNHG